VSESFDGIIGMNRWLMIRHHGHRPISVSSLPNVVKGRIRCNLVEPRPVIWATVQPVECTICPKKSLLAEVLCLPIVPHHPDDVTENLCLVTLNEILEDRDFGHSTYLPVAFAIHLVKTREHQKCEVADRKIDAMIRVQTARMSKGIRAR